MSQTQSLRDVNIQLRERGRRKVQPARRSGTTDKGDVVSVKRSPVYEFVLNGVELGSFSAELEATYRDGRREAVVKSIPSTPHALLQIKLLKAFYGVDAVAEKR